MILLSLSLSLWKLLMLFRKIDHIMSLDATTYRSVHNSIVPTISSIHTYIILQSGSASLASHTTHVVCVNFIRDLQFNVDSFLKKLFRGRFNYAQSFCQKSVVVCVNFIRDLQFNVDSFLKKLFRGRFNYAQNFCQKSVERKSPF